MLDREKVIEAADAAEIAIVAEVAGHGKAGRE